MDDAGERRSTSGACIERPVHRMRPSVRRAGARGRVFDEASKGSHSITVWLCGLLLCAAAVSAARLAADVRVNAGDMHAAATIERMFGTMRADSAQESTANTSLRADLAVYLELHETRDAAAMPSANQVNACH